MMSTLYIFWLMVIFACEFSFFRTHDIQKVIVTKRVGHANKYRFRYSDHIRSDLFSDKKSVHIVKDRVDRHQCGERTTSIILL